ncbi:MAG: 2,3,4,5-tetrahydropyridine-2,6-dicarboxylate N-succinyltransferase, partial [Bacteroidales bacterium]
MDLCNYIEQAWQERSLLKQEDYKRSVAEVIELLDKGKLRVAEAVFSSEKADEIVEWRVNEWVKKAILLYFAVAEMKIMEVGPLEFYDKIPLKKNFQEAGVRVVPHGVARYGAFLSPGSVMMPSYVNIGAYVGSGTLIDTWATVGSCAQIGERVHLSGGVGIGGVLEPVMANPVIVENDCFVGSRSIIVEGVRVEKEAVIGANVCLTQSTKIIDVSGKEAIEYRGRVPARSVVIP